MNNTKDTIIDIDGTEFLEVINTKLERNLFFKEIEDNLLDIKESKTIHYGNIQELMTYLSFTQEDNEHYYKGLKHFIEEGMCPLCAIEEMDTTIQEDNYLFVELLRYLVPDVMSSDNMEVA